MLLYSRVIKIFFILSLLSLIHLAYADKPQLAQRLSLPSGPGSIDGLGESYSVATNTGTSCYSFAVSTPPARAGLGPDLRIDYDSGFGNGLIGMGMRLNLSYIQRQMDIDYLALAWWQC